MKILLLVLAGIYLLNCLSPIRLHVDTLRYFAIKDCIELGCPPDSEAARDYFPYGYTAFLLILSKLHLLHSAVIILFNCAYLFGGIWLASKLFPQVRVPYMAALLVLLNWTVIKFVTHPLSEMQYLFFSTASLYFFYRYTQERKVIALLGSFACGGLAFLTRSVGLALVAGLVVALLWQYRRELILIIRRNKILAGLLLLVLVGVIVFSRQLGLDHYAGVFNKQFEKGVTFPTILKWHFTEWSEIAFNTSIVKLLPYFPASVAKLLYLVVGVLLFAGFASLLFLRRKSIPFVVSAYLLFYILLLFEWPFYDPRFWVPVLPLMAGVIFSGPFPARRLARGLLSVFCAGYIVLGVLSVGYMTYTSLNREVMARTQANGVYRNEYETYFFGRPLSDTATKVDPVTLSVIRRYH